MLTALPARVRSRFQSSRGSRSPQTGMGLVEFLISLVVFSLILTFATPGFGTWMHNSHVRTTAESVRSGLQLARSEAVRRNSRVVFALNGTTWTVAGGGITVQSNEGEPAGRVQVAYTQNAMTFDGVGWVMPLPAEDIAFDISSPSGGACATDGGPIRCLRVVVSGGGQIRMCDPAAAAGQAAAC
jgi:type IV fimbrial biogenesis protein FimT